MTNPPHPIQTERLDLIPATLRMLECEGDNRAQFGRMLDARVPQSWPPPLLDEETRQEFLRILSEGCDPHFCSWYWVLKDPVRQSRTLIGSGGTASCSWLPDAVMIGYSVLEEFQNRGYATEAILALIPHIFSWPAIRRIIATTYPELKASVRVLVKAGFVPGGRNEEGQGIEEGTVLYVLHAPPPPVTPGY